MALTICFLYLLLYQYTCFIFFVGLFLFVVYKRNCLAAILFVVVHFLFLGSIYVVLVYHVLFYPALALCLIYLGLWLVYEERLWLSGEERLISS